MSCMLLKSEKYRVHNFIGRNLAVDWQCVSRRKQNPFHKLSISIPATYMMDTSDVWVWKCYQELGVTNNVLSTGNSESGLHADCIPWSIDFGV